MNDLYLSIYTENAGHNYEALGGFRCPICSEKYSRKELGGKDVFEQTGIRSFKTIGEAREDGRKNAHNHMKYYHPEISDYTVG